MRVVNLGAQVDVADLVARAVAEHADAVLVSQVVTQRDAHLASARALADAFSTGVRRVARGPLLVVGGPRFDPDDGGRPRRGQDLRPRHHPREVASYLVHALTAGPPRPEPGHDRRPARARGLSVTHRRYVPASHAHYGGNLVDGAYVLGLFGDVGHRAGHPHRRRRVPASPPTPTSSSWPRCWQATSSRQRRS